MYIPRLLVLTLLISVWVAPVAAQSLPDKSNVPQSLPTALRVHQLVFAPTRTPHL
jgi:hypothetical protein